MLEKLLVVGKLLSALGGEPNSTAIEQKAYDVLDSTRIEQVEAVPEQKEPVAYIKTETDVRGTSNAELYVQRTTIKQGNVEVIYDSKLTDGKENNPRDNGAITFNTPFEIDNSLVKFYNLGDVDQGKRNAIEVAKWFSTDFKDFTATFDVGAMSTETEGYNKWLYADAKNKDWTFMGATFYEDNLKDKDKNVYGIIGRGVSDNLHTNIGANKNTRVFTTTTQNLENFGSVGFVVYDQEKGDYFFKTRTAIGKPDLGFYTKKNADFVTTLFTFPPFFKPHFSPFMTKGINSVMIDGSGNLEKGLQNIEVMAGRQTKYGMFGAGFNNSEGKTTPSGFYYLPFEFKGVECSFEFYSNSEKGNKGYFTLDIPIGGK